jgi:formylglycine-generating enzyme required for sulfatase activity
MKNLVLALLGTVILLFTATRANAQQCCTGNVSTYCTAGTSVLGCLPSISGTGVPSADATSGFLIQVGSVPAQRQGLVFYGFYAANQAWAPFSPSYLCVAPPVQRTGAMSSGGVFGQCNGRLEVDFNAWRAANPTALGYPFAPGQTIRAQGWYRDPAAPSQTNLSNALEAVLCAGTGDITPPVITACATNQTVGTTSACQGIVPNFTAGVLASDSCGIVVISQIPSPGTTAQLGANLITILARDAAGNTTSCAAVLTVVDTTAASFISCAPSQTVSATSNCQAIVPDFTGAVSVLDECGGSVFVSQQPNAGSYTAPGATSAPVTITAADSNGNLSTCVTTLHINQPQCGSPSGMSLVAPGTFLMGEAGLWEPTHTVQLTYFFWIGIKEVSQLEYLQLIGSNPSHFQGDIGRPVENVNWHEARAYCAALSAQQAGLGAVPVGYEYRLPTEAEWEYACRAGSTTSWNVGSALSCIHANHYSSFYCTGPSTVAVGNYAPNAWGIFDMHGNVKEWCLDIRVGYSQSTAVNPFNAGAASGGNVCVVRGGAWNDTALFCRSAARDSTYPDVRGETLGFRVVLGPILVP